jgi:hypothetical protein
MDRPIEVELRAIIAVHAAAGQPCIAGRGGILTYGANVAGWSFGRQQIGVARELRFGYDQTVVDVGRRSQRTSIRRSTPIVKRNMPKGEMMNAKRHGVCIKLLGTAVIATWVAVGATASRAQDQWKWPDRAENLKILPKDTPPQQLRAIMIGFSRSLGVHCAHCHVGEEGKPLSTYDFKSDKNPKKATARVMLTMVGSITEDLKKIEPSGERVKVSCVTCHRGVPRPLRLDEELGEVYAKDGLAATVAEYRRLRDRFYGAAAYDFSENSLNILGYRLLEQKNVDDAIAIFRLNVEFFPQSGNAYDSLAEAYMTNGQKEIAAVYYQKAVELDPDNKNALGKLQELRGDEQ